jgi:structural maintenance of chromosome 4
MFEMADRLVGIYKTQNSSKSITINPHKFAAPAEAVEQPAVASV